MSFPRLPLPEELSLEVFASESLYVEDLLEELFDHFGEFQEPDIETIVSLTESIEQIGYCFGLYNWQISATSGGSQNISEVELFLDGNNDSVLIVTSNAHRTAFTLLLHVVDQLLPDLTEDVDDTVAFVSERYERIKYTLSGMRCGKREVLRLIATLDRERACVMDQYYDFIEDQEPDDISTTEFDALTSKKVADLLGYGIGNINRIIRVKKIDKKQGCIDSHGLLKVADFVINTRGATKSSQDKAKSIKEKLKEMGIE